MIVGFTVCCCDLLKIRYICGRNDNLDLMRLYCSCVVICSKFAIFAVEMTTKNRLGEIRERCDLLKIRYLCGRNDNFSACFCDSDSSCDLLKIRYLCGRNDNKSRQMIRHTTVVICSKFAIFAVEMTTLQRKKLNSVLL